ncbi:hypothetical protein GCM10009785_08730 [Brooklawnia cerclae]|uniref:Uncharacterized protein n=1 Tax=Brooklawnia cerclae TaxID=349934 RepID=A0ABX0SKE3_9ACTN|nr:hypothetical protein [Brooklawnia cerclae]NIH58450.1 hypothetical protein [Brooklawnia cerclae]
MAGRSTQQWSARSVPALRRELVQAYQDRADRIRHLIPRGGAVAPHLVPGGWDAVERDEQSVFELRGIDLFWVTGDMGRLALDASLDVPEFDPAEIPVQAGLIVFQDPMPALQTQPLAVWEGKQVVDWQGDARVWALSWHPRAGGLAVTAYTRLHELPGPLLPGTDLQPVLFLVATRRAVFSDYSELRTDQGTPVDTRALGVFALLASATVMMMTPTLAERRTLDARSGRAPHPERTRPSDLVSTIDLRPLRHVHTPDDQAGAGREYTHRWIVRGHWTHQPYGPGNSLRKLLYREPYIKGPEDGPLILSEKVMVWRR